MQNLSQVILKVNAISIDKNIADQKISDELKDQVLQQ